MKNHVNLQELPDYHITMFYEYLLIKRIMTSSQSKEGLYLRDDIIQFATDISQSNFNIKQFKKLHSFKPIKIADQRTKTRIYTEHRDTQPFLDNASLHSKTVGQGLNKSLRYNESNIALKKEAKIFSKQTTKSADRFAKFRAKTKVASIEKAESLLQKYERDWTKGRMKERSIEEWLNAILIEYCHDQYFDKNIANSALKKLGIDENSLVAKGLPPQNITRLYRGLFVFGMGFNSLINELACGNMQVLKTIWRIYSIILEYCSRGGMQTVVGQIERETGAKVAALTAEIVRRQEIIQKNEEINEEKNGQIFREIKKLREDNVNLNNQKTVLAEQFSATQQAFSQEVGLRLKFQTKINQIYGLHRQLGIKHQKLFAQFSGKLEELRVTADRYFEATVRLQELRQGQYKLREQLVLLKMASRKDKEYLEELLRERVALINRISRLEFNAIETQNQLFELRNREKIWLTDKINLEATLQFRQKSTKQTHAQYQMTLEQNNRLYILLSDQRKVMEDYEKEKKNFNSKVISIVSENSYHKRKMEEANRRCDGFIQELKQKQSQIDRLTLNLQILTRSEESLQQFFSNSQLSLVQMRRININNQQELSFLRNYHRNMEKVLNQKNAAYQDLFVRQQAVTDELQRKKFQFEELQSKFNIANEQKRIAQEFSALKDARLKQKEQQFAQKQELYIKLKTRMAQTQETLRIQLQKVAVDLKNEKFQRSTLTNSYNQTLRIIQKKNATEKEQSVKISLLEGEIQNERTRYRQFENNIIIVIQSYTKMQQNLQETLNAQRKLIIERQQYIHPLFLEDLHAALSREAENRVKVQIYADELKRELKKLLKKHEVEIEKMINAHKHELAHINAQHQNKVEQLDTEIAFEKQEVESLKIKVQHYQELADSYRKKISERSSSDREEIYKHSLEEKKKQLDDMMKQMERLQDELQHVRQYSSPQTQLTDLNQDMDSYERLKIIDSLRKELEHQYQLKLKEIQRELKRDYSRREAQLREENEARIRGMTLEDIMKLKQMNTHDLLKELSVSQKSFRKEMSSKKSLPFQQESVRLFQIARPGQSKRRQNIGRLIKNAYEYYK